MERPASSSCLWHILKYLSANGSFALDVTTRDSLHRGSLKSHSTAHPHDREMRTLYIESLSTFIEFLPKTQLLTINTAN